MKNMETIIDVNTGEVKYGKAGIMLRSVAIGSCIVIAAYDAVKKTGAMAHIMLPGNAPKSTIEKTKYAVNAVDELLALLMRAGTEKNDIEICLIGGGNVLKKKNDTICKENIESVTKILAEKQIPIRASVLGGVKRKGIFLDIQSGRVSITEGDDKEELLWQYKQKIV